jgi:hypothetical protein
MRILNKSRKFALVTWLPSGEDIGKEDIDLPCQGTAESVPPLPSPPLPSPGKQKLIT